MANINLNGILRDSLGEVSYGNRVKFTHESTTGETLGGFASVMEVVINGEYDIDLEYGNVLIESYDKITARWIKHGVYAINSETPATSLPSLIGITTPLSDPDLLLVQNLVADAELARNESLTAKDEVLNRVASYELDSTESLINTFDGSELAVGEVVKTLGFYSSVTGREALWTKTAEVSAASQTPVQLGDAKCSDINGAVYELQFTVVHPKDFGATAIHGVDDGPVLNLAASIFRAKAANSNRGNTVFDGEGLSYYTLSSINFTKINGTNYSINNMSVHGACAGTNVLDFVGSRFGSMKNVKVSGNPVLMPSRGILFARAGGGGTFDFCDGWTLENVTTDGYFSEEGYVGYAQESTNYILCRFWNYQPHARGAAFTGDDDGFNFTSDYSEITTGQRSYIQDNYLGVDVRFVPNGNISQITNITKSNPAVVKVSSLNGWVNGDSLCFQNIGGMDEIEGYQYKIANIDSENLTVELVGLDSTGYTAFTSGGTAVLASTVSPMYLAACEQHDFTGCYVVSYGASPLELAMTKDINILKLDLLFEGAGFNSLVHFSKIGIRNNIYGFDFQTYKTLSTDSVFSSEPLVGVELYDGSVKVANHNYHEIEIFDNNVKHKMINIDVSTPNVADFDYASMLYYSGNVSYSRVNDLRSINMVRAADIVNELVDYVPEVSFSSGDIGDYTIRKANYTVTGRVVNFNLEILVSDIGTGAGYLKVEIPNEITPAYSSGCMGREAVLTGGSLQALLGNLTIDIRFVVSSIAFASGQSFLVSGSYIKAN